MNHPLRLAASAALLATLVVGAPAHAHTPPSALPTAPSCTLHGGNSKGDLIADCTTGTQLTSTLYRDGQPVALPTTAGGVTYAVRSLTNVTDSGWVAGVLEGTVNGAKSVRAARWNPAGELQLFTTKATRSVSTYRLFGITDNGTVVGKEHYGTPRMTLHSRIVWGPDDTVGTYPDAPHSGRPRPGDGGTPQVVAGNGRIIADQFGADADGNAGWTSWTIGAPAPAAWLPCPTRQAVSDALAVASPNGRYVVAQCGIPGTTPDLVTTLFGDTAAALPGAASKQTPIAVNNDGVILTSRSVIRGTTVTPLRTLVPNLLPAAAVWGRHLHGDGTILLLVDVLGERRYVTVKTP